MYVRQQINKLQQYAIHCPTICGTSNRIGNTTRGSDCLTAYSLPCLLAYLPAWLLVHLCACNIALIHWRFSGFRYRRGAVQCHIVHTSTCREYRWDILHRQRGFIRHLLPHIEADIAHLWRFESSCIRKLTNIPSNTNGFSLLSSRPFSHALSLSIYLALTLPHTPPRHIYISCARWNQPTNQRTNNHQQQ